MPSSHAVRPNSAATSLEPAGAVVSVTRLIMNARMYAVTPAVEAQWRTLLEHVTHAAGVELDYVPYPAPQPLETLWARPDLGCVFMCGYPVALQLAAVVPIAAPVPRAEWAAGRPVYRSDLIVREDSPFRTLADTFGGRAGWTVEHSHSGFNAFRHHLLSYRTAARPALYGEMVPNLITARAILDAVREGRIDVGPLDAYWHLLIRKHSPALTAGVRVLESTAVATLPAFVTGSKTPENVVTALRAAFADASRQEWFSAIADELLLDGFAPVTSADYARTLEWDREAKLAGYPLPA
jgi:ABC-type phosphate/phosphonate transport system substrate-binding protein